VAGSAAVLPGAALLQSTPKAFGVGSTAKMAVLQRLIPKWIKIKPIVRRKPGVMLETIDITLRPIFDVFGAVVAIQDYFLGESLEINFVAVVSKIETKE
jgi:hypothetical protein